MRTLLQFQLDEGSTPLILACKNGHLELVKFMIERCGVNISQTGSVTFDGEDIEGAPPLWCAAAAGHVDVVRYLVNKGAYINKTTRSNSTPLRAACYDGHLKVVQFLVDRKADIEIANRHGHTCLMIACYRGHINVVRYLLDHGAQVNRQSTKGNTALHDGAESGKLDIVKLLLKRGSHITRDAYGQTALTAAAMTGHMSIVDYLIGSAFFKPNDQANALELLGATFVDKTHDHILAFRMWQKALDLRKRTGVEKKRHAEPVPAYNNAVEVCNHEECEVLTHDPDLTRMQALLIRERVLGYAHPETSFCIRFRGALYADGGDFERCMTLWLYTLETQTSRLDPLADGTMSSFVSFVELFAYVFVKGTDKVGTGDGIKDIFVETVLRVVELGVEEVIRHREAQQGKERKEEGDSPDIKKLLVALLHIVSLVNYVTPLSNASSSPASLRLQKILYRLVKMRVRTRDGSTLMHLACSQNSTGFLGRIRVSTFPSLGVARLLLKVGADPDARDNKRRTALHLVCQADPIHMSLVGALLAGGAHPDMCDEQHASPLDKLKDGGQGREVCPVANSSLKCLAARAIAHSERLTPDLYEGKLGRELEDFIKMH
ncbi:hypothetical protein ACOMHN_018682 [Nucella lapillus]